jgi:hypothetical protein
MAGADDGFDPSRFAQARLLGHILGKGWQAGSFLGLAAAPLLAWRAKSSGGAAFLEALREPQTIPAAAAYGAVGGASLSGELLGARPRLQAAPRCPCMHPMAATLRRARRPPAPPAPAHCTPHHRRRAGRRQDREPAPWRRGGPRVPAALQRQPAPQRHLL